MIWTFEMAHFLHIFKQNSWGEWYQPRIFNLAQWYRYLISIMLR